MTTARAALARQGTQKWERMIMHIKRYWPLYVFLMPAIADVIIFRYAPMYGLQIAFKDFKIRKGVWDSDWVGMKHLFDFVESPNFWSLLRNTLSISLKSLLFGFPVPILLALSINEIRNQKYKRVVQTITYAPHFLSLVAVVGLINLLMARETGIINELIEALGGQRQSFLTMPSAYAPIFITSGIWQEAGWGSIIYLAALSSIDVEMMEAAQIDGVTRFQKIWYIDLPSILPTIAILLIMRSGQVMSVGYEKVLLLQNDLIRDVSEVISTYNYRMGIVNGQFSYTTSIGLFNSVVNCILLLIVNRVSRAVTETSLW